MKQSFWAITLCLVILLGLTACSKGSVNISDPTTSTPANNTGVSVAGDETEESTDSTTTTASNSTETTTTETPIQNTTTKANTPTTTKKPVVTTTKQQTPTTTAKPTSQWDLPARGNEELLKQRILYYINEYRVKEGNPPAVSNKTPAMQRFADLRAIDITINFAHDMTDKKKSSTKAEFGQKLKDGYWDEEKQEFIELDTFFYSAVGGEAIGFDGTTNTVDVMAKNIAEGYFNSKNHWAYIGHKDNVYLVIGTKYANGSKGTGWYTALECCNEELLQYAQ